jgi:hypothetical protein
MRLTKRNHVKVCDEKIYKSLIPAIEELNLNITTINHDKSTIS